MKLSKLKFVSPEAFHVDCSYKPTTVQLSAVYIAHAYVHVRCNGTH